MIELHLIYDLIQSQKTHKCFVNYGWSSFSKFWPSHPYDEVLNTDIMMVESLVFLNHTQILRKISRVCSRQKKKKKPISTATLANRSHKNEYIRINIVTC